MHGLKAYTLSAAIIGGLYGGYHSYIQLKDTHSRSDLAFQTLKYASVGAVAYPFALPAMIAFPYMFEKCPFSRSATSHKDS